MHELMAKYHSLPMDLADAAIVRVAEREHINRVFTIDQKDFRVYRPAHIRHFTLLPSTMSPLERPSIDAIPCKDAVSPNVPS
jgi:hypothetical protein